MCFRPNGATASRRRRSLRRRPSPTLPPLAMLDLSKPGERQAHEFLCRATRKRDRIWELFALRRHGEVLLCVVRWTQSGDAAKPFSLAEVSLTESAVHWRYHASIEAARAEMRCRSATPEMNSGETPTAQP
jgi:hypothetical protein